MPTDAAPARPLEHSILLTVTLCLLAVGAVMVYSASSAEALLDGGDSARYLKRYVIYGALGLLVMRACAGVSLRAVKRGTPIVLLLAFALTVAVMVPGVGVHVNGATRWLAAGPVQFQPSELLKVSLVLYAAALLAARPRRVRTFGGLVKPLTLVIGAACALLMAQPDMGTALVICATIGALLVAAGARIPHLAVLGVGLAVLALIFALTEPYRRARLTAFLDPWADAGDTGFQAVQAMIAIGSGGLFGVGLGESVQKVFYLPEAHTDMILAIIGEELGLVGIGCVVALYVLLAYAGLRASKVAGDRYTKLLGAGITALILCQATLNLFAVMGLAPVTGIPLPFISYGNSNMLVLLGAMGLLINIAARGDRARVTDGDDDIATLRRRSTDVARRRPRAPTAPPSRSAARSDRPPPGRRGRRARRRPRRPLRTESARSRRPEPHGGSTRRVQDRSAVTRDRPQSESRRSTARPRGATRGPPEDGPAARRAARSPRRCGESLHETLGLDPRPVTFVNSGRRRVAAFDASSKWSRVIA